jgi:hypothetical protein
MCFGIILYHLRRNIILNRLKISQKENHQLWEKIVNELLKTKLCADGLYCKYKNFFLNAYWIKSGGVDLTNYVFLTSYPRMKKSFRKSAILELYGCCNFIELIAIVFLLLQIYVCIGSAQMKTSVHWVCTDGKKGFAGLNAYL